MDTQRPTAVLSASMSAGLSRADWIARERARNTHDGIPPTVGDPAVLRVLASVWSSGVATTAASTSHVPAGGRSGAAGATGAGNPPTGV